MATGHLGATSIIDTSLSEKRNSAGR